MPFIVHEKFTIGGQVNEVTQSFEEFDEASHYIKDFISAELDYQGEDSREIRIKYERDYIRAEVEIGTDKYEFWTEVT